MRSSCMVIYTIGHSTRSLDDLVALLKAHGITRLADVRTVPRSRRHPHFAGEALAVSLPAVGIAYRHMPGLGGLRKPRPDSSNSAWRHEGFRGYADYMQTPEFDRALTDLIAWADPASPQAQAESLRAKPFDELRVAPSAVEARVVMMCAEAVWWRCHRQLIADALVARGIDVRHITAPTPPPAHKLTEFARVADGRVTYPGLV
jgi:uncharacterized protein (DUF488 family)